MPSSTTAVSDSDAGRSSPNPSVQSQPSLMESAFKCDSNSPGSPKLALEIPEDENDTYSSSDSEESLVDALEYPSIAVKALRARQFFRRIRALDKDYLEPYRSNWDPVKLQFSLLFILAQLYEEREGEKEWPAEWDDEAAVTFFFENTAAKWAEDVIDESKVGIAKLAEIFKEGFAVDGNDAAALENRDTRVVDFIKSIIPIPEADQGLEELDLIED
ncbi:hypothetical protein FGADI_10695 [Fusarium gaditjirri]|uniref:Uncharacterized protein n=1 Tax=Fusarium gaditjirri TaxID=282569 RepID=A0A8H4SWT7_9HYPO|nr:hypothetical protein FGADI_10695 [Fusarium gaditjirri]